MSGTRWQNATAEAALLGLCLADAGALAAAQDLVAAADFYDPGRAFAWEALAALHARRRAPTPAALEDELARRNRAQVAGVPAAFGAWRQAAAKVRDVHDAAAIVAHAAAARRTVEAAQAILDRAEHGEPDPAALAAFALDAVTAAGAATGDVAPVPLADALAEFCADVEARRDAPRPRGVTTGLAPLDARLVCLEPGDLVVLAGRPGTGKTTLAQNVAAHVAAQGRGGVLYFSLEMANAQLAARFVGHRAGINTRRYRLADVTPDQWRRSLAAMDALVPLPLWLVDRPGLTIAQLRAGARRHAARAPLALVVVDYCQLVAPERRARDQTREREVAQVVWGCKVLAGELGCPVLLLSQLNRESESQKRRPRLSDLRESGSLEQDAAVVLLLHREKAGPTTCIVAKNRHDATGEVALAFDGATATFGAAPSPPSYADVPEASDEDF